MRATLAIGALIVLSAAAFFGGRSVRSATGDADHAAGPSFVVEVDKPFMARPLFGLLPAALETKLTGDAELRFDQTTPGAEIGDVKPGRVQLLADGWDLMIEIDSEGRAAPTTFLRFPLELGGKLRTLRCRTENQAFGRIRTVEATEGSGQLHGDFVVELALCANTATGRDIEWPPAPLTVHGTFERIAIGEP